VVPRFVVVPSAVRSFRRPLTRDPVVVFVGDQVTAGWVANWGTHPLWINKAVAGQTSAETLAGLQAVINSSPRPEIIHVITGTQEALNDPDGSINEATPVIANITSMAAEAKAAGIKIIVGTELPGVQGSAGVPHPPLDEDIDIVNEWIVSTLADESNVTVVDYFLALSTAGCDIAGFCGWASGLTADGVSPNAAGYAIMTPLALDAIQEQKVGGIK
jgi:acyl-CoA thioesterase I